MIEFLKRIELYVAGVAFVLMLGVITLNVFARYLFSTSILSSEELAYLGFTWTVFAAVSWLYRERALVSVEVFFDLLPQSVQRWLAVVVDVVLIGANAWFCRLAWVLAAGGWVRKTPVLHIPYFWINIAPVIAFGLMTAYSVLHLVQRLTGRMPARDADEDDIFKESAL